jgi:protein-ribulosamine 3-kinase
MLPEEVHEEVERELGPIRGARPVGGGCINPSLRLDLDRGPVFLKFNPDSPAGMFAAEACGLEALRAAASGLRVPEVFAWRDTDAGGPGWLALEWLEPGARRADTGERLGRGLAALHRAPAEGWGWERDGFIGSLPQVNAPAACWAEWDRLLRALPEILAPAEDDGPSLLHGDLWSGNVLASDTGEPALVDPAAYRGHREVDLAMSELFGGFPPRFLDAYREAWPLRPGYGEVRRGVYQLFFLLVHVNIFGGGYARQTEAALRGVLARL